jgi:hypothetical protein
MPAEKPPEKHRILAKAADIATNVVNESAAAMKDESDRIDAEQYELSDMVATVTKVVNAGIAGATGLARIPLEEKWPERHLVMGDYVSTVVRGMVTQAGTVAQAAANDIENKKYTPKRWLESMTRLIDIAVAGGMDIAETLGAGPAQFQPQPIATEFYDVTASKQSRELGWAKKPTRDGVQDWIDDAKLQFEPKTLLPGAKQFRVLVVADDLLSGVYKGEVQVGTDKVPVPIQIEL